MLCLRVDKMSMFCSFQPAVDLLRVRHPLHQCFWCRTIGHQEGEDLLRRLDEKLALPVLRGLEERHRQSLRLRAAAEFFGGPPIGTTLVERVPALVTIVPVVKLLDELAGRVVDDRGVTSSFDLS